MTRLQRNAYWKLWQAVCRAQGWSPQDDERRHAIHREALGQEKSSNDFTNADLDQIFPLMRRLSGSDLVDSQVQLDDYERGGDPGERRRLLWRINKLALDLAYVRSICAALYKTTNWERLPIPQLTNLRNTLANRARQHRAAEPVHADLDSNQPF
ncbi:MAG: hypothetical protein IT578_04240 [Verrucomicrobiae bacterium]|nr:hypothetical protein [Verrucomicrobiae bacterium]